MEERQPEQECPGFCVMRRPKPKTTQNREEDSVYNELTKNDIKKMEEEIVLFIMHQNMVIYVLFNI